MSESSDRYRRILEYVRSNPGIHFNAICRGLELSPEHVERSLQPIRDRDMLVDEELFGQTHFYPPEYDTWERAAIALLRRETARDVVLQLLESRPAAPADLADEIGVARSTLEWHLGRLIEAELVEKRPDGRRVFVDLVHPERTEALLPAVRPDLPDKWIDRTMRLVDHLIDGGREKTRRPLESDSDVDTST